MCFWASRIAFRASPSRFEVAALIRFSIPSTCVPIVFSAALPPLERRAVVLRAVVRRAVVRRDEVARPLALRLVLLRAVVLRAPPALPAVLRLAVLRAAGDI
jgi:hypothetical protein